MMKRANPNQMIKSIASKIGRKFHPKRIILFGSYANGRPHRDSDVDLLIIFQNKQHKPKIYADISQELEPRLLPIDLLIRSTKEIQRRLEIGDSFIKKIVNEGKVLYES
jgi:uncharacterized protein